MQPCCTGMTWCHKRSACSIHLDLVKSDGSSVKNTFPIFPTDFFSCAAPKQYQSGGTRPVFLFKLHLSLRPSKKHQDFIIEVMFELRSSAISRCLSSTDPRPEKLMFGNWKKGTWTIVIYGLQYGHRAVVSSIAYSIVGVQKLQINPYWTRLKSHFQYGFTSRRDHGFGIISSNHGW